MLPFERIHITNEQAKDFPAKIPRLPHLFSYIRHTR